jgi:transposase
VIIITGLRDHLRLEQPIMIAGIRNAVPRQPRKWLKQGSKRHLAVYTPGSLPVLHVTPASADDRPEVGRLAQAVQASTGQSVDLAYVDQGYTSLRAPKAARAHGTALQGVTLPAAKRRFVLLPLRWVVERSLAQGHRFRRLVTDYERYASTLADLHLVTFTCIMLKQAVQLAAGL